MTIAHSLRGDTALPDRESSGRADAQQHDCEAQERAISTTFRVTERRPANLSEDERRRRLHLAYSYILSLRSEKATDPDQVEEPGPSIATDTMIEGSASQAGQSVTAP